MNGGLVSLANCPIGLFLYRGELCLKTEYSSNEGRIEAYIVSSGESFGGDAPQTTASQRSQLVLPVDLEGLLARTRDHALDEVAQLIELHQIGHSNTESGSTHYLAPRYEGNREGLHYAEAIRAMKSVTA